MPRCAICDYDDTLPSICNDGLVDGNVPRSFVWRRGEDICSICLASIEEAIAPATEPYEESDSLPQDDEDDEVAGAGRAY